VSNFRMVPYRRSNVLEVYEDRAAIFRDPVYQRISGVWDLRKKQLLIDSILNGFDIPKLYFHQLISPLEAHGHRYSYAVIDGKQRLEAIWEFMDDGFHLAQDFRVFNDPSVYAGGLTYSQLNERFPLLRMQFDGTDLPIVALETEDEELVENLFSRLNEAVPLTAAEYRNTLGGPIPRALRELVVDAFFRQCLPFETGRHRHLDLAAKFLYITEQGRFVSTKKTDLDHFVIRYRSGREQRAPWANDDRIRNIQHETRRTLSKMNKFFEIKDELLARVGMVTLYFHAFRLMPPNQPHDPDAVRSGFRAFESDLAEHRRQALGMQHGYLAPAPLNPLFTSFDRLRQALNDGSALYTRYTLLYEYLQDRGIELPAPPER
jgi:Protein of unknown function DUF262